MRQTFNPADWYWLADDGRVFSSARSLVVTTSDTGYVAFAAVNTATRWPADHTGAQTSAALQEVLSPYGLFVDLVTKLEAYASAKQAAIAAGGISVDVGPSGSPQLVAVTSDQKGCLNVAGAVQLAGLNPSQTFNWVGANGIVTLSADQMRTIGTALGSFIQSTYTILGQAVAGIAGGSITSTEQIDSLSWPANS